MKQIFGLLAAILIWSSSARAEGPKIITDIAPIHALTAQIMSGVGTPKLLIPQGISPYHYQVRPSDFKPLSQADLVITVGPELSPFLAEDIADLGGDVRHLILSELPHTLRLARRGPIAPDKEAMASRDEDGDGDDAVGRLNPHLWLDPENAHYWLQVIADELALIDPENAVLYLANADMAGTNLDIIVDETDNALTEAPPAPFILYHDSYHYFEFRFGLEAAGVIVARDSRKPRPTSIQARLAEWQQHIEDEGVRCIISTPYFRPAVIQALSKGKELQHLIIDPFGADIEAGEEFYTALIMSVGHGFQACQTD